MDKYYYSTNLHNKIDNPPIISTKYFLCMWTDLLGFGNIFFDNNWELSDRQKINIYTRLQNAHNCFLRNTLPFTETSLILNDGLVKLCEIKEGVHPDYVSLFLRSCIYTHNSIKEIEIKNGFPGPRSILTYGDNIEYLASDIKLDDYVYNYTKPDPNKLSRLSTSMGNPIIVYNPSQFQMNMAFSKAYILDRLGTSANIKGNNFFIDKSALDFSISFADRNNIEVVNSTKNDINTFYLKKKEDYAYWGFILNSPFQVNYKGWQTEVSQLYSFYPHDEAISEFIIDLI